MTWSGSHQPPNSNTRDHLSSPTKHIWLIAPWTSTQIRPFSNPPAASESAGSLLLSAKFVSIIPSYSERDLVETQLTAEWHRRLVPTLFWIRQASSTTIQVRKLTSKSGELFTVLRLAGVHKVI